MKSILCTLVLCMFMGGGRISVFGKTVRPAAESGCSASPAGSEKISKQRARAYRKKQTVWQKAQAEREAALREARIERDKAMRERQMALREAQLEREAALREARIERDKAMRERQMALREAQLEREAALREARIERDKAMRERQMALREARIEREAAMREACAERRKDLDVALRKQRKVLQKTAAKQKKGVTQGRAGPATGMGALGNDRSEAADDFSSAEIRVWRPHAPAAVGLPGGRIRPYTSDFVVPRFSRVAFLALRPFVLPVGNGAGANSGRAVGIAFPDIRIVRVAVVSGALPHRRFEIFVIFVRCGPGIEAVSGIRGSGRRPAGSRPQRPGGSSPLIACLFIITEIR